MKKRILALICLILLCISLLSGCRCKPFKTQWYVQSFQKNEAFVTGGEYLLNHTGYPSVRDPFAGMAEGFVSIAFAEDGTVVFEPGTGEVLTGTYTYEHKGIKETKVYVTLDSGETFTCTARSNSYGSSLTCSFREKDYLFEDIRVEPHAYYEQCLQDLIKSIRYWCTEGSGEIPVNPGNIETVGQYIVLTAETLDGPVVLDETVAVRCFYMDENNNLHAMDTIEMGDCHFAAEKFNDQIYVTIYYVEPVK